MDVMECIGLRGNDASEGSHCQMEMHVLMMRAYTRVVGCLDTADRQVKQRCYLCSVRRWEVIAAGWRSVNEWCMRLVSCTIR